MSSELDPTDETDPTETGTLTYSAGTNVALVAAGAALLFAEPPTGAVVARCWPLVRDRVGVAGIVGALLESGLSALHGFALVCVDATGATVVLRGSGTAVAADGAGLRERFDAADLATWCERRLAPDIVTVTIGFAPHLPPSTPPGGGPPSAAAGPAINPVGHPLVGGTVLAGSVTMRVGVTPDHAGEPVPAPPAEAPAEPPAEVAAEPAPVPGPAATPPSAPRAPVGTTVQAVACPYGHLGPPYEPYCRICATAIEDPRPFLAERPPLGLLRLSTGDVVPLDRGVIMGRNPRVADEHDTARPHLVRLPSPDNDVSRTHVEVRLEDWHVLVVDLGSTNGTTVSIPGQAPVRLRAHEAMPLEPNAEVNLADEIVFRFEVPTR